MSRARHFSLTLPSYVESLRDRIHELEEGQAIADTHSPFDLVAKESELPKYPYDSITVRQQNTAGSDFLVMEAEADDETTIDAMGVFGAIGDRVPQGFDFFGPSSTIGFIGSVHQAMSPNKSGTDRGRQRNTLLGFFQAEMHSVKGTASKSSVGLTGHRISIPPRKQADALFNSYWDYVHSLYPFLHRPSFTEKYLTLWSPPWNQPPSQTPMSQQHKGLYVDMDDRLFHCLLNLVFALGSQFDTRVDDRNRSQVGMTYFERAKALLDFDMLFQGNIYLVQMLLLMGLYLQSTDMTSACWNMVGLAIRIAQGIGLHHQPDFCDQGCCSGVKLTQLELEMRSRAWTGCILFDRYGILRRRDDFILLEREKTERTPLRHSV